MKKIWKYIVGFFAFAGGILLAFFGGKDSGRSAERIKGIDKKLKSVKKDLKAKEKEKNGIKKSLKSKKKYKKDVQKILVDKKKELEKLKKVKEKKVKDVSADDAADFLKKYAKKK